MSELRKVMRQAAWEYVLGEAAIVAEELAALNDAEDFAGYAPVPVEEAIGEHYTPEVEMGGARDFGEGAIIGRAERKEQVRGILHHLRGQYADIAAWVEAVARESPAEAQQDPGDIQPADLAGDGRCRCQRRFRNGGECPCAPCPERTDLRRPDSTFGGGYPAH